jgi:hypothetical protein
MFKKGKNMDAYESISRKFNSGNVGKTASIVGIWIGCSGPILAACRELKIGGVGPP